MWPAHWETKKKSSDVCASQKSNEKKNFLKEAAEEFLALELFCSLILLEIIGSRPILEAKALFLLCMLILFFFLRKYSHIIFSPVTTVMRSEFALQAVVYWYLQKCHNPWCLCKTISLRLGLKVAIPSTNAYKVWHVVWIVLFCTFIHVNVDVQKFWHFANT